MFKPSGDGIFRFKFPSNRTFGLRKPTLGDVKRAGELAGPSTKSDFINDIRLGEQLAMLLLTEVDGQPVNYAQLLAGGGLEKTFEELQDVLEVIRLAGQLKGEGQAVPLEG